MRQAAIYLRVSTLGQTTVKIVAVHRDNGISGVKGRYGRPGFDALCKAANRR